MERSRNQRLFSNEDPDDFYTADDGEEDEDQ